MIWSRHETSPIIKAKLLLPKCLALQARRLQRRILRMPRQLWKAGGPVWPSNHSLSIRLGWIQNALVIWNTWIKHILFLTFSKKKSIRYQKKGWKGSKAKRERKEEDRKSWTWGRTGRRRRLGWRLGRSGRKRRRRLWRWGTGRGRWRRGMKPFLEWATDISSFAYVFNSTRLGLSW